jgi:hypothetical protein
LPQQQLPPWQPAAPPLPCLQEHPAARAALSLAAGRLLRGHAAAGRGGGCLPLPPPPLLQFVLPPLLLASGSRLRMRRGSLSLAAQHQAHGRPGLQQTRHAGQQQCWRRTHAEINTPAAPC